MLEFLRHSSDFIGIIGVIMTLTAYYLLNINKLSSMDMVYLVLNFVGSALVLYSLFFNWNLASVIIEAAWVFISFIGIYRVTRKKKIAADFSSFYIINENQNTTKIVE